jgi:hypothetical protein
LGPESDARYVIFLGPQTAGMTSEVRMSAREHKVSQNSEREVIRGRRGVLSIDKLRGHPICGSLDGRGVISDASSGAEICKFGVAQIIFRFADAKTNVRRLDVAMCDACRVRVV